MARVLIGWELGGGHGHAVNLVTLGRALVARGHEVVIVARDVAGIWPVTRAAGIPFLQAPVFAGIGATLTGGKPFQARRFTDVLAAFGYGESSLLEPQVRAWDTTVNVVRPDLVVAEFAPTLCLATHGRVPTLAFGIGYCVPCLQDGVFPLLNPSVAALASESRLREGIAATLRALGREVPAEPLDAVLGDEQLMISMDEIDPYRAARRRAALGPLASMPPLAPAPVSPYALIYLPAEHPQIAELAAGLAGLDMPGIVYVRGAKPALLEALRKSSLEVSTSPLDLDALMARASVVMHHGGPGTVQRCLAAGVPQVVAPVFLEQHLVARELLDLGVALAIADPDAARRGAALLATASADETMRRRARELAEIVQAKYPGGSLDAVVDACLARLG